jgi:hypothetical protein
MQMRNLKNCDQLVFVREGHLKRKLGIKVQLYLVNKTKLNNIQSTMLGNLYYAQW